MPVTIIGKPETILEVDGGSIFIDLAQDEQADDNLGEDEILSPNTPTRDQPYLSQATRETFKAHALNRGTPLTKIYRVARIQVCEIRFNRTKANAAVIARNN